MKHFDIVILGAGPAGYSLAAILANHNKKVAIIEKNNLGGTCVNAGCIPSKTLIESARLLEKINKLTNEEIQLKNLDLYYQKTITDRLNNSEKLQNNIEILLNNLNVKIIKGQGKLIDSNTLKVNQENIKFDKLVIATGTRPRILSIPGFEQGYKNKILIDTTEALSLQEIPKNLTIIGAGVISLEMAYFYSTFGTEVTILETADEIFSRYSNEVKQWLKNWLVKKNIKFVESVKIEEFKDNKLITTNQKTNSQEIFETEKILIAAGRVPNIEGLEALNLVLNKNSTIKVNEKMKTSVKNVYAIGDVNGILGLTTSAYKHGDIVAKDILNFSKNEHFNPSLISNSIYLDQEISMVGLNENQLTEKGVEFIKLTIPGNKLPRNFVEKNDLDGFLEIVINKHNFKILSATIILKNSSLLINHLASFIAQEKTIFDLQESNYTHPTLAEAIYYLARNFTFKK